MQRLEDKNGQLKVDSLADWKPMELPKDWSDMVTPPGSGHQSRGSVLNSLKPLHQAVVTSAMASVTVAKYRILSNRFHCRCFKSGNQR